MFLPILLETSIPRITRPQIHSDTFQIVLSGCFQSDLDPNTVGASIYNIDLYSTQEKCEVQPRINPNLRGVELGIRMLLDEGQSRDTSYLAALATRLRAST